MSDASSPTALCIASFFKGEAFLEQAKREGCRVVLVTNEKLADRPWPRECIDEVHLMHDVAKQPDILHGVSYLARDRRFDYIVPLDDYDVEIAAALREHLRIPGMGDTTARYFRDKLAMRVQARDEGMLVPEFVPIIHYDAVRRFLEEVPPPWVLKPRSEAGAIGIKKLSSAEELWAQIEELGDRQSYFLLERFVPGDVYHVDSIVYDREILFSVAQRYGSPPLSVANEGGIFTTLTLDREGAEAQTLRELNREVIDAMGMVRGVTHAEFIRGHDDGRYYFLELAGRVGGAHVADMVEAASGINLWAEWARVETARARRQPYTVPDFREDYAGLIISLAKQEYPDTSAYDDPEVVWRLDKRYHAGLIVSSPERARVNELVDAYAPRWARDFLAVQPPLDEAID